jgi:hypothetical protein
MQTAMAPTQPSASAALWSGAPVPAKVFRRHVSRAFAAVLYQLGAIGAFLIGMHLQGADSAIPWVAALLVALLGGGSAVAGLLAARRAIASAAHRRYTIADGMLVTESPGQRHERRLSNLPELVFEAEGGGVGTISCALPRSASRRWLERFVPTQPDTAVLLESVADATRALDLLHAGSRATERLATAQVANAEQSYNAVEVRRVARPIVDLAAAMPIALSVGFAAMGPVMASMVVRGPWSLGAVAALLFSVAMAAVGLGGIVVRARELWIRARVRANGVRVMADVRGPGPRRSHGQRCRDVGRAVRLPGRRCDVRG